MNFVSRAGQKLEHALKEFAIDVKDKICADLGCSTGGFTDCLLQHGARQVFAVDTGYGVLDWKLRNDPRVVVMERTNSMLVVLPV
jgi:23S rRNA (cytidine1920-2'-O)/16S rRNA (cytidine1409-2'-O)-methyltransferase